MRMLVLGLLLALLALAAPVVHGQHPTLHWSPASGACEDAVLVAATGQCEEYCIGLSAPRVLTQPTVSGEAVEVGLWDPSLGVHAGRALATVTAPNESTTTTMREAYGATWISLHYPADFPGAESIVPGAYTIVWETRGLTICDGFEVSPPPADPGALSLDPAGDGAQTPARVE